MKPKQTTLKYTGDDNGNVFLTQPNPHTMNTTNQQTGEGNAPRKSNGAIRCTNALQYAAQRLSDAMQLYPPTHLEIAKRKLTFDLISNHAGWGKLTKTGNTISTH